MHDLAPSLLTTIGGFPIYNTFLTTLVVDLIIVGIVYFAVRNISMVPKTLQNLLEMAVMYFYDLTEQIAGKSVVSIFPWVFSFFLFIFLTNLFGLLPGVGSILFYPTDSEHAVSLFRPATSDFNATLALALISFAATQYIGIKYNGLSGYFFHFFKFKSQPIYLFGIFLFVGILEVISEIVKIFSLSFRLFGNIFAGEVVLSTINSLVAFIAPVPFLMLESVVAIVQALVFSMLTMAFMSALSAHEGGEH